MAKASPRQPPGAHAATAGTADDGSSPGHACRTDDVEARWFLRQRTSH